MCVVAQDVCVFARVQLQSVLQWISQLHLFKGSAERERVGASVSVKVLDLQDAAHLHAQQ